MSKCTDGEWVVVEHKDDSYDRPYYTYSIIAYPHGREVGSQLICCGMTKFDAKFICEAVNFKKGQIDE